LNPDLRLIAPRLGLARDQFLAEREALAKAQRRRANALLRLQWLVAHRELQLLRAGATDKRRYIATREKKLAAARRELDELLRAPLKPRGLDFPHDAR